MQNLLNMQTGTNQGLLTAPWWSYVQNGLQSNLDQVISYYRMYPTAVNSSHFLCKLLTTLGTHQDSDYLRFINTVNGRSLGVAMSHQMTSSISRGILFDGIFYGEGVSEIIIGHNENFDLYEAKENWRNLQPIKILRHPKSDLSLMPLNGKSYNSEQGLAVISINMVMLAVQYREFSIIENKISNETGESPRSMEQFILAYPLTNALKSHLDHVLFNRLYNLLKNKPLGDTVKKHSFFLVDYSDKLLGIQKQILQNLQTNYLFDTYMRNVPLVTNNNLLELSTLPECPPTRQVIWGLVCSRLPILDFLFSLSNNTRAYNSRDINNIQRYLNLFQTEKALKASLPINLFFNERSIINKIMTT